MSARPIASPPDPAPAATRVGHVHLKVADLDRAIAFYSGVLGFEVMQHYGTRAAFLGVVQGTSNSRRIVELR